MKERLEEINNFSSLPLKKRISLTKESIKKELKANDYHMPKNININTQYLLEIIEQAERVQELEETNKKNYWIAADFKFENLKLEQQNKRYRKALEFYADEKNHEREWDTFTDSGVEKSEVMKDGGEKARQALEGEE